MRKSERILVVDGFTFMKKVHSHKKDTLKDLLSEMLHVKPTILR